MMLLIPETTLWEPLAMFLVPSDQADTLAPSNIIDLSMERVLWAFNILLDVLKIIPCTLKATDEAALSMIKATLSNVGVEVQVEAPSHWCVVTFHVLSWVKQPSRSVSCDSVYHVGLVAATRALSKFHLLFLEE